MPDLEHILAYTGTNPGSDGAENRPWQSSGLAQRSLHRIAPMHTLSHPHVTRRSLASLDPVMPDLEHV